MTLDELHRARRRVVAGGIAGNVMEWYDFAIYGYFVRTIGRLYFRTDDPTVTLLAAYGAFAVGFLMRPLGAVVFGFIGDRIGRGPALLWSVVAMAVPTFAMGLLPTYEQIGYWAAGLMVACRAVQGLSVGGEYTGSAVYLAESALPNRRALASAWAPFGGISGMLLGSAVGALVINALPLEDVVAWGWRAAFLFGGVLGCVGFLLRRRLAHDQPAALGGFPLAAALRLHRRELLQVIGVALANSVGFYLIFFYIVPWLKSFANVGASRALLINSANMAVMLAVIPAAAWLADRYGRKPLLAAAAAGLLVLSWPLLALMQGGQLWGVFIGQLAFTLLIGTYAAILPVAICELFPRGVRCSAVASAYNISAGIAGGTAPMMATRLVEETRDPLSPALYLSATALLSLIAILWMRDGLARPLEAAPGHAPRPAAAAARG